MDGNGDATAVDVAALNELATQHTTDDKSYANGKYPFTF